MIGVKKNNKRLILKIIKGDVFFDILVRNICLKRWGLKWDLKDE